MVLGVVGVGLATLLTLVGNTAASAAPSMSSFACTPVLITVAGSNERDASPVMDAIGKEWSRQKQLAPFTAKLATIPVDYPAQPWTRYVDIRKVTVALAIPSSRVTAGINWDGLTRSENVGVEQLQGYISQARAHCPNRFIGIVGYSQGADVVSRTLTERKIPNHDRIAVVLLGNPSYDDNEGSGGIRPTLHVATHRVPRDIATANMCLQHDPICRFSLKDLPGLLNGTSGHYKYKDPSNVAQVVQWMYKRAASS
jgi:hypothetical protein